MDDSSNIYIKSTKHTRNFTIRELEDHLIELKRKKLNTSGIISKLLIKYCTECLDSERTMTIPVRESHIKRVSELESIYFDQLLIHTSECEHDPFSRTNQDDDENGNPF